MGLVTVHNAIATTLAATDEIVSASPYAGRFDLKQLSIYAKRMPCLLISCLGGSVEVTQPGDPVMRARWVTFLLTHDRSGETRHTASESIIGAVVRLVRGNVWGCDEVQSAPSSIDATNLYEIKSDQIGISVWGVSWEQEILLTGDDDATYEPLETIVTDYQIYESVDDIDATDEVTLEQS